MKTQWKKQATYLGGAPHKNVKAGPEIQKIMSATSPIARKLQYFWTKAECSKKWKLNNYNAVIVSKLLYCLEPLQSTETQGKQLDAFSKEDLDKY